MKKVYTAPQILFESFTMSTNIAAGCEKIVTTFAEGECAILGSGNIAVFSSTMTGICTFTPTQMGMADDMWNEFCYHVPTANSNLFNS